MKNCRSTRDRWVWLARIIMITSVSLVVVHADAAETIDASKYPNLQAAFDAVPATGGIVKIPPGEFRISQPLVISKSETRVVGSGAATKIVNLNTNGKPALMVRPANRDQDKNARIWRVQLADFRICGDPQAIDAKSTKPTSGDG